MSCVISRHTSPMTFSHLANDRYVIKFIIYLFYNILFYTCSTNSYQVGIIWICGYQAVVAEWLRRLTRNQIPSGSVGSNPTDCVIFLTFKISSMTKTANSF
uniref:Uncharacterized protein n=1 Tax=Cacopsylla melanoneura TaxID=428564 RepID=A0A8D8TFV9_9HEMI